MIGSVGTDREAVGEDEQIRSAGDDVFVGQVEDASQVDIAGDVDVAQEVNVLLKEALDKDPEDRLIDGGT